MHEQSEQKVVHYFHYDNYSKKVVKKGNTQHKNNKESGLNVKGKGVRDKKSPENTLNTQMKKLKPFTQSSKNLNPFETKTVKKCKSPEPVTSRLPASKKAK